MRPSLTYLPKREGYSLHRRGEMRETKVCLFLPELLWLAVRRRAAQQGVSALHLVRLALAAFEPDWESGSLVTASGGFEERPQDVTRFPKEMNRVTMFFRARWEAPEDDSEGLGMLVEGKDIGEVAQEASRGIWARSEALRIWGTRAAVVLLERELHRSRQSGQPALFTSKELVG